MTKTPKESETLKRHVTISSRQQIKVMAPAEYMLAHHFSCLAVKLKEDEGIAFFGLQRHCCPIGKQEKTKS